MRGSVRGELWREGTRKYLVASLKSDEILHANVPAGQPWTFGRSTKASLSLFNRRLSAMSVAVRSVARGDQDAIEIDVFQQAPGTVVIQGEHEFHQLSRERGSLPPKVICGGRTIQLSVMIPSRILHVSVEIRDDSTDQRPLIRNLDCGTTVTGLIFARGPDPDTAWLDIAALSMILDDHPELVAVGASPSQALRSMARLWCGKGSNDFIQGQLRRASAALGLSEMADRRELVRHLRTLVPKAALDQLAADVRESGPFGVPN